MLKSLLIKNFVLIDELDIHFEEGFSVVTGETGAGKSVILGALSLVLGERADSRSIQSGSDKCTIEACFGIFPYHLKAFFDENDIEYDENECVLRRELFRSGKSRAFINDSPVQLSVLKKLGNKLIDIHSQHQNMLLSDVQFQLGIVDLMAQTSSELSEYQKEYRNHQDISLKIGELKEKLRKNREEEDYVRFQFEELESARFQQGEQEQLEQELETLSHSEEIKTSLYKITELLHGEEISVVQSLKEALSSIEGLTGFYPKYAEYAERIRSAYLDMEDLASESGVLKDDVDFEPERLHFIQERINLLYTLQQKHHVSSVDGLIAKREEYAGRLREIESYDDDMESLEKAQEASYNKLIEMAKVISSMRKRGAGKMKEEIIGRMVQLGIPYVRFQISLMDKNPAFDGADDVCFMFSANKNEPLKPVSQTASGGEISRLMLCVKAMISGYTSLPSIIFDEIDTGVSGEMADKMAVIMQELGSRMQVLAITHLPQIAAKGTVHYFVYKEDTCERTFTRIKRLTQEQRVDELARMLSGSKRTTAAVENAKSLLNGQ